MHLKNMINDKLQALLLATVVTLSVLTGAVGATAATAAGNVSDSSVDVSTTDEEATATFDIHTEVDLVSGDNNADYFYVEFPDEYEGELSVEDVSLVNSEDASEEFEAYDVSVVDGEDNDGVSETVRFATNTSEDADVTVDLTVSATHPRVVGTNNYALALHVVDSANADVSGHNLGSFDVVSDDETLNDGGTYWKGMTLERTTGVEDNEILELFRTTSDGEELEGQVQADENGVAEFNTGDLKTGTYYLEDSDNNKIAEFQLAKQDLAVTIEDDAVVNDGSDSSETNFNFDSNRANYDVIVSAPGLSVEETASIFEDAAQKDVDNDDEDEIVVEGLGSAGDTTANFTGIDATSYNFDFQVVDTSANDSVEVVVSSEDPAEAKFDERSYVQEEGDVAEFSIELENTDEARLEIGSKDVNYRLNLTVTDGNDDGNVTLQWNTYEAGNGNPISVVDEQDSITVLDESGNINTGSLDPAIYRLSAFVSNGNLQTDVAVVDLNERATYNASSGVTPYTTSSDLDDIKNETTYNHPVAMGDDIVLQFNVSGVYGYLDETDSLTQDSPTHGMFITINETNPKQNVQPVSLSISKADTHFDAKNNTMFFVLDTDTYGQLEAGDNYNATLHVTADNPYVEKNEEETVSTEFSVVERKYHFYASANEERSLYPDERVEVRPDSGQTIHGETTLAPGTEFRIMAISDSESSFFRSKEVTVQDDGTFSAEFDFSNVARDTKFTLETTAFSGKTGAIVKLPPEASATASDQSVNADNETMTVTVDSATLSHGGFVTVVNQDGERLGTSEHLEAGEHENIEIEISSVDEDTVVGVFAAIDSNQDGELGPDDERYSGSALAQFNIVVEQDGETPTTEPPTTEPPTTEPPTTQPPTTQPANNTTTAPPTTEPPATDDPTTTESQGQPGFGVAVALIALVAAALVAARRRNE